VATGDPLWRWRAVVAEYPLKPQGGWPSLRVGVGFVIKGVARCV
jgi:hypothetical protein